MPTITAILTTAVALIGVYIAFSLLVSWVQEQIAGIVGLRSKTLILGIRQLMADHANQDELTKQLISTVGEPFTVSRPPMPAAPAGGAAAAGAVVPAPPKQGWASKVGGWTGLPYVGKFFSAPIPYSGDVKFPSYVSSRDFVANLLTYVNDKQAVTRADAVLDDLKALGPHPSIAALPSGVISAPDGAALLDAARRSADVIAALPAGVPENVRTELAGLLSAVNAKAPDVDVRAEALSATLQLLPADVRAKLPPLIAAATDAKKLIDAVPASAAAITQLAAALPDALRNDLQNLLATGDLAKADTQTFASLEAAASAMPKPLSDIMVARLRDAQGNYETFVASLEQWFDDYMARIGGWYKRCATLVTLYLSVIVVLLLNLDSISLARNFTTNSALAQSVGLFGTALLKANDARATAAPPQAPSNAGKPGTPVAGASPAPEATPTPLAVVTTIGCPPAPAPATPAPAGTTPCGTCPEGFVPSGTSCAIDTTPLRALPLGYPDPLYRKTAESIGHCDPGKTCGHFWGFVSAGLLKLLGWLLTVIALCLGAPFWFDVLRTIVNVRSGGSPPPPSSEVRKSASSSP